MDEKDDEQASGGADTKFPNAETRHDRFHVNNEFSDSPNLYTIVSSSTDESNASRMTFILDSRSSEFSALPKSVGVYAGIQQKHWPNEIRQFHPETKFPRNAPWNQERLKGCDSTRLGPVQTELRKSRHSWTQEHEKMRGATRFESLIPVVLGSNQLPLAGFARSDDQVAGR